MTPVISIIIPNYNGSRTIGKCLESVFAYGCGDCEVIVVDDRSMDDSLAVIRKFPCKLVQLERNKGAAAARNAGANSSSGDFLFFMDADCLLTADTLPTIRKHLKNMSKDMVIGGTYTPIPADPDFFSFFQSVFINYFETKRGVNADYLAAHALLIQSSTFNKIGGFDETFVTVIEDVEFCHRLRRAGYRLVMDPDFQVRHIFGFSLFKSLRNASRKTRYWTLYSLANKDLLADSGTASRELKFNGFAWGVAAASVLASVITYAAGYLAPIPLLWGCSVIINRGLIKSFYKTGGAMFACKAGIYYTAVYPAAVWAGFFQGIIQYRKSMKLRAKNKSEATRESIQPRINSDE